MSQLTALKPTFRDFSWNNHELAEYSTEIAVIHRLDEKIKELLNNPAQDFLDVTKKSERLNFLVHERYMQVLTILSKEFAGYCEKDNFNKAVQSLVISVFFFSQLFHFAIKKEDKVKWIVDAITIHVFGVLIISIVGIVLEHNFLHKIKKMKNRFLERLVPFNHFNTEVESCAICYELFKKDEKLTGHLANGKIAHVFHTSCIDEMLMQGGNGQPRNQFTYSCPLCCKEVLQAEIFKKLYA